MSELDFIILQKLKDPRSSFKSFFLIILYPINEVIVEYKVENIFIDIRDIQ